MRRIAYFDSHDYRTDWSVHTRHAVRAVIQRGGRLLMIHSMSMGCYCFPGGGMEPGESQIDTLLREAREEVGATLRRETARPLGMIEEVRRSRYAEQIWHQFSYYYYAVAEEELCAQQLEAYERALDYRPVWVLPEEACRINERLLPTCHTSFLLRENTVIRHLMTHAAK